MVALTLNMLWTNSADNKLVLFSYLIIFPYFSQEKSFKVSSAEIFNQIMLSIEPASVAQLDAPSNWRPGGRGFNQ